MSDPDQINLSAVARKVGCTPSMLAHVRAGRKRLSPELRERVAVVLAVPQSIVEIVIRGSVQP